MSHVEAISVECRDLDALRVAAEKCGGELVESKTHGWWGVSVGDYRDPRSALAQGVRAQDLGKCDFEIRMKGTQPRNGPDGPWSVGVVKAGDGYSLRYDNFGSAGQHLERMFGKDLMGLRNELAAEVTMRTLIRDGYRMSREVASDGSIVLTANR